MKVYSSIFFDLDNTLLDFHKAENRAIKKVLSKHGLPASEEIANIYSQINKSYWERFEKGEIEKSEIFEGRFKTLFKVIGCEGDTAAIQKDYFVFLSEGCDKVDGAIEILEYLKNNGYKIYATTNGVALTQFKRIKNSGLEPYFDKVFVSEDTGHQKPEKEYFDYVIANIPEKDKTRMLIIGDSQSSDILGGVNSGIDTCWFNINGSDPKYKSQYEISALSELKGIL